MRDDDMGSNQQWYQQHPVVSTVLWLIGGIPKTPELFPEAKLPRNNSRLSWKDEHDGEIAEYITHESNASGEKKENKGSMMPRQRSQTHVGGVTRTVTPHPAEEAETPTIHSDDTNHRSGAGADDLDEAIDMNTMSPQWGWYVSTTPPQELYGKTSEQKRDGSGPA